MRSPYGHTYFTLLLFLKTALLHFTSFHRIFRSENKTKKTNKQDFPYFSIYFSFIKEKHSISMQCNCNEMLMKITKSVSISFCFVALVLQIIEIKLCILLNVFLFLLLKLFYYWIHCLVVTIHQQAQKYFHWMRKTLRRIIQQWFNWRRKKTSSISVSRPIGNCCIFVKYLFPSFVSFLYYFGEYSIAAAIVFNPKTCLHLIRMTTKRSFCQIFLHQRDMTNKSIGSLHT